ncbi:hypothetical protein ACIBHY_51415 [Nonomuraea sp. NPDC050547]|uniref:hypothetical protein n=1 Tax=Nonomuraea sp. NPDC050547 TaxID=3364368 RepID=UPI0037BA4E61
MSGPFIPPTPPAGLIGHTGQVRYGDRGPLPRPGTAVVYANRNGDAVVLPHRPSMLMVREYQTWHEVDIARHQSTVHADVRSHVDTMHFHLQAEVMWGVSDPVVIVRHGTADGESLVRAHLVDRAWKVTRRFDIEQCGLAEEELQKGFEPGPIVLDEGITLYTVIVKLHSDAPTAQFYAHQRNLTRIGITDQASFKNQSHLEKQRVAALKQVAMGEDDLLFLFLSRHPDQVGTVLEQVVKRRELNLKTQMALFEKLVDEGYIQEADVESMRQVLLKPIEQAAHLGSTTALGPAAPPQALQPAPAPPRGQAAPAAPAAPAASPPPPAQQAQASDGVVGWVKFGHTADDQDDS